MRTIMPADPTLDESLSRPELVSVAETLARRGVGPGECVALVSAVTEVAASQEPVVRLRAELAAEGIEEGSCALEQLLLLTAARASLPAVPGLPVGKRGRELLLDAFTYFATPEPRVRKAFAAGHPNFASMCKVATLRRFPVGQFEWEVSGIPRSLLLRVPPRALPRVLHTIAFRLGRFSPLIFPHFAICGGRRLTIPEAEVKRGFYRMATALELQPALRGVAGASWFFAPDAYRVSPHLAWLADLFLSNGGLVTTAGEAGAGSGALAGSAERRRLYEAGEFRPMLGLAIWPRAALLEWAGRHPELDG